MANELNELEISKIYGIHVPDVKKLTRLSKKKKEKLNICVPYEALKDFRERYDDEFKKFMDKNRHASFPDKLKIVTGRGTLSPKENQRRNGILKAFKKVYPYISDACAFFADCKGHKELQKYADQINKDFENMTKKGYIKNYDKTQADQFDATKYYIYDHQGAGQDWPDSPTYGARAKKAYENMFEYFKNTLADAQQGGKLLTYYHVARKGNSRLTTDFTSILEDIRETSSGGKELRPCLEALAPLVKKEGTRFHKAKYENLMKNLKLCEERLNDLNRKATLTHMQGVFYRHRFSGDVQTNRQNLDVMDRISDHIIQLDKNLDRFGKTLGEREHSYRQVKSYFQLTVENYEKLRDELEGANFPEASPLTADADIEQEIRELASYYKRLAAILNEEKSILEKYNNKKAKFLKAYDAMKNAKSAARKKWLLLVVFAFFGSLTTLLQALSTPIATIASGPDPAPADFLPD